MVETQQQEHEAWSHGTHRQEADRDKGLCSAHFLLFLLLNK